MPPIMILPIHSKYEQTVELGPLCNEMVGAISMVRVGGQVAQMRKPNESCFTSTPLELPCYHVLCILRRPSQLRLLRHQRHPCRRIGQTLCCSLAGHALATLRREGCRLVAFMTITANLSLH